jgi:hypothetical protein
MSASTVSPGVQAPPVKYVVFRLGGAVRLALPQMAVREGLDMASVVVAPMPGAAAMFQGIANVRGNFLWVAGFSPAVAPVGTGFALARDPRTGRGWSSRGGQRAVVVTIQGRDGFLPLGAKDIQPLPPSAPQAFVPRHGTLGGATGGPARPHRFVSSFASILREVA